MRPHAMLSSAACCGFALLAAGRLAAIPLPLPAELPLDALPLTLELSHADVEMIVGDAGGHLLRARLAPPAAAGGAEPPALDVVRDGGRLTVRRIETSGGELPRLRLDLVVAAGQKVRLAGSDLVVRIEDLPPNPPEPEAESADEPRAPALFHLDLESSEATLVGVIGAALELTASSVWLDGSGGSLALTLEGGSAEVRGHRGDVTVEATGAEVAVRDLRGSLTPRLTGGRLRAADSAGKLAAAAEGATLLVENWRGQAELIGRDASLEARAPQGGQARWLLEGEELRVVLEQLQGGVEARLQGGSLEGSELRGEFHATAAGTRLELAGVEGQIELTLTGAAEARLSEVSGGLAAEVTDSSLDVEGVDQLQLKAARARISGRRVARVSALEVSDSELELDLREILHDPALQLAGSGTARVRLPTPCVVQIAGSEGLLGYSIEVTNCELRGPGHRVTRRQDYAKYGANPPRTLRVAMSPDIDLEVAGDP